MKKRSGQSYTDLARKTYLSSSTLHRYCTGKARIPDAAVLTRIARACGATDQEIVELTRAWLADRDPEPTQLADPAAPTEPADPAVRADPEVGAFAPARRSVRRGRALRVAAVALLLAATGPPGGPSEAAPTQWVSGPSWVIAPKPVEPTRFGVTVNSNTGEVPGFRVGSVRFWDSHSRWTQIEPRPGEYDWSATDRLVNSARRAGLPALFVLGGTPAWAAPDAPRMAYPDGSRAAAPDDLRHWERFVGTLAERYRGRIEAYELWPNGNDRRYYAGDTASLVELTRVASRAIRQADPKAVVVCPGMGRLWSDEGRDLLRRFAEAGGYAHCDVAAVKLHQRIASDPPETVLSILDSAYKIMHGAGVHPPIWSTGTTHDLVLEHPLDEARAIDHAVRFFLAGIYGSASGNLQRTYFYAWGNPNLPIVLQAVGGAPTKAALAVEQLQRWLARARVRACGKGAAIRLPANVWQCEFTVPDASGRQQDAVVRWTHAGTASTPAPPGAARLHRLDGVSTPISPGDFLDIGTRPVLITRTPATAGPPS
ncbi:helix-turn-helix domain-containing protein [Nonomuraea longicatena]|uniref:helix-turn-helix domain-containing protein n=1 Tax=Nonomuraea longicatena TaxID=83682 RepID=UPI0031CE6537